PLIPGGSGSSMPGGAVGDGVILDLSRLRDIESVNVADRAIIVQPGVLRAEVNEAVAGHGLRFPVDPSSAAFCTIGGMVSTNAAGPHSLKFGATRSWVRSLDCVFSDGSRARVTRGEAAPSVRPVQSFLARAERIRSDWAGA